MTDWQPIESAPKVGEEVLLYFPAVKRKNGAGYSLREMTKVDTFPVCYPRQPTHWMPLPPPPGEMK